MKTSQSALSGDPLVSACVTENVWNSVEQVLTQSRAVQDRAKSGKLKVVGAVYDINSGMKIYQTALARKYLHLAPDTMAFSDIITLVFINNRHLVLEEPITISSRLKGKSTIGMQTAFQTVMEIVNVLMLFNPMKIFLPIAVLTFTLTLIWGVPLVLAGRGISTGTLLGIIASMIFFFLGLITEQLSQIRRNQKQG